MQNKPPPPTLEQFAAYQKAWQQDRGTPPRRCYHNPEWADKMPDIGLIPSDTGEARGSRTGHGTLRT
jgi:hypothetical protein